MEKQERPAVTVGALIFNPEGKMLLVKSHKWKGKYVVPGGHIELGEKAEEALKREIMEETGLEIYEIMFIMYQDFVFDDLYWKRKHFVFLDFSCKSRSSNVRLNGEAQEYVWVLPEDALDMDTEPYTKNTIREYLKKRRIIY